MGLEWLLVGLAGIDRSRVSLMGYSGGAHPRFMAGHHENWEADITVKSRLVVLWVSMGSQFRPCERSLILIH